MAIACRSKTNAWHSLQTVIKVVAANNCYVPRAGCRCNSHACGGGRLWPPRSLSSHCVDTWRVPSFFLSAATMIRQSLAKAPRRPCATWPAADQATKFAHRFPLYSTKQFPAQDAACTGPSTAAWQLNNQNSPCLSSIPLGLRRAGPGDAVHRQPLFGSQRHPVAVDAIVVKAFLHREAEA